MDELALFDTEKPVFDWTAYDERISAANTEAARRRAERRQPSRDHYWTEQAEWWLNTLTRRGDLITADDLIAEVGLPTGSGNQVGARFTAWHRAGMIRPVGYVQSTRPSSNGRAVRRWEVTR